MVDSGYVNGFIERKTNGTYQGNLTIDGINISPIIGKYFKQDNDTYLWLRRKNILEYDETTMSYKERDVLPRWECYLKKQVEENTIAYKGTFFFMRFCFEIIGVWDKILGSDKHHRLNLYVERLPMAQQSIINSINKRKRDEQDGEGNKE